MNTAIVKDLPSALTLAFKISASVDKLAKSLAEQVGSAVDTAVSQNSVLKLDGGIEQQKFFLVHQLGAYLKEFRLPEADRKKIVASQGIHSIRNFLETIYAYNKIVPTENKISLGPVSSPLGTSHEIEFNELQDRFTEWKVYSALPTNIELAKHQAEQILVFFRDKRAQNETLIEELRAGKVELRDQSGEALSSEETKEYIDSLELDTSHSNHGLTLNIPANLSRQVIHLKELSESLESYSIKRDPQAFSDVSIGVIRGTLIFGKSEITHSEVIKAIERQIQFEAVAPEQYSYEKELIKKLHEALVPVREELIQEALSRSAELQAASTKGHNSRFRLLLNVLPELNEKLVKDADSRSNTGAIDLKESYIPRTINPARDLVSKYSDIEKDLLALFNSVKESLVIGQDDRKTILNEILRIKRAFIDCYNVAGKGDDYQLKGRERTLVKVFDRNLHEQLTSIQSKCINDDLINKNLDEIAAKYGIELPGPIKIVQAEKKTNSLRSLLSHIASGISERWSKLFRKAEPDPRFKTTGSETENEFAGNDDDTKEYEVRKGVLEEVVTEKAQDEAVIREVGPDDFALDAPSTSEEEEHSQEEDGLSGDEEDTKKFITRRGELEEVEEAEEAVVADTIEPSVLTEANTKAKEQVQNDFDLVAPSSVSEEQAVPANDETADAADTEEQVVAAESHGSGLWQGIKTWLTARFKRETPRPTIRPQSESLAVEYLEYRNAAAGVDAGVSGVPAGSTSPEVQIVAMSASNINQESREPNSSQLNIVAVEPANQDDLIANQPDKVEIPEVKQVDSELSPAEKISLSLKENKTEHEKLAKLANLAVRLRNKLRESDKQDNIEVYKANIQRLSLAYRELDKILENVRKEHANFEFSIPDKQLSPAEREKFIKENQLLFLAAVAKHEKNPIEDSHLYSVDKMLSNLQIRHKFDLVKPFTDIMGNKVVSTGTGPDTKSLTIRADGQVTLASTSDTLRYEYIPGGKVLVWRNNDGQWKKLGNLTMHQAEKLANRFLEGRNLGIGGKVSANNYRVPNANS